MPSFPPASTFASTRVVESHSYVPSDSGPSVGITYAATSSRSRRTSRDGSAMADSMPRSRRREETVPLLLYRLDHHAHRIRIALDERGEIRFRVLQLDMRRKRRHVAVRDHLEQRGPVRRKRAIPGRANVFGMFHADAVEAEQLRIVGVGE